MLSDRLKTRRFELGILESLCQAGMGETRAMEDGKTYFEDLDPITQRGNHRSVCLYLGKQDPERRNRKGSGTREAPEREGKGVTLKQKVLQPLLRGEPKSSPKTPGPGEAVSPEDQNKEHKHYAQGEE